MTELRPFCGDSAGRNVQDVLRGRSEPSSSREANDGGVSVYIQSNGTYRSYNKHGGYSRDLSKLPISFIIIIGQTHYRSHLLCNFVPACRILLTCLSFIFKSLLPGILFYILLLLGC